MCNMNYEATASKAVNPTIVKMRFTITASDKDVEKAVNTLNETRKKSRKDIFLKDSLIQDSFTQTSISVQPMYKNEEIKVKVDGKEVTKYNRVFDTYTASTTFSFNLSNTETIIDDFTDILNMGIKLKTKCYYDFDITPEERLQYEEELTAQAVDDGIKSVKNIMSKSEELKNLVPYILEIRTNNSYQFEASAIRGAAKTLKAAAPGSADDYPEIITPEIVIDIFNNKKIFIESTVGLVMDLKSSKAI